MKLELHLIMRFYIQVISNHYEISFNQKIDLGQVWKKTVFYFNFWHSPVTLADSQVKSPFRSKGSPSTASRTLMYSGLLNPWHMTLNWIFHCRQYFLQKDCISLFYISIFIKISYLISILNPKSLAIPSRYSKLSWIDNL